MELSMNYNDGNKNISVYNNTDNSQFMMVVNGVETLFTNENEMFKRFRQECGINL